MTPMHNITLPRVRGEEGQDLIEYALLTALISIVALSGVKAVGSAVLGSFWSVIATGLSVQ
jgi:Flp pilus assembly pilin Flp